MPLTTRDMPGANPPDDDSDNTAGQFAADSLAGKPLSDQTFANYTKARDEFIELRAIGDQMQSALSRILSMLDAATDSPYPPLDYETQMAVIEGHSCIERWTEVRKHSAS